jgi:hypothetical protein
VENTLDNWKERDHYEDQVIVGRIINNKMDLGEIGWGSMDLTGLAQDKD